MAGGFWPLLSVANGGLAAKKTVIPGAANA